MGCGNMSGLKGSKSLIKKIEIARLELLLWS
jgi:hypothetical protein